MAYLTKCSVCSREVSSEATACPGCGHGVANELSQNKRNSNENAIRPDSSQGIIRISYSYNGMNIILRFQQGILERALTLVVDGMVYDEWHGNITIKTIELKTVIDNTEIKAQWSGLSGASKLFINGELATKGAAH
ncbi:MAG: hypothetical protein FWF77_02040 [Defluviitaleaceae bacterium]|nr:hypothetical protein [Defluviitaleaceae bacterium]